MTVTILLAATLPWAAITAAHIGLWWHLAGRLRLTPPKTNITNPNKGDAP